MSVNVHTNARQCSRVQFWREIGFFSLLALKKFLSCLTNVVVSCNFNSKVWKKVRVLETVHDIVEYQVSDLIS